MLLCYLAYFNPIYTKKVNASNTVTDGYLNNQSQLSYTLLMKKGDMINERFSIIFSTIHRHFTLS